MAMSIYLPLSLYPNWSVGGSRHKVVRMLPLFLHSTASHPPLLASTVTHFFVASVRLTQLGTKERVGERVPSGSDKKESAPLSSLTPIQAWVTLLKEEWTSVSLIHRLILYLINPFETGTLIIIISCIMKHNIPSQELNSIQVENGVSYPSRPLPVRADYPIRQHCLIRQHNSLFRQHEFIQLCRIRQPNLFFFSFFYFLFYLGVHSSVIG